MQGLPFCPQVTTALTSNTIIAFCCFWISHKGHHSVGYSVFRGSSMWSHMAVFHSFPLVLQWELAVPVSHFSLELCICLKQNLSHLWDLPHLGPAVGSEALRVPLWHHCLRSLVAALGSRGQRGILHLTCQLLLCSLLWKGVSLGNPFPWWKSAFTPSWLTGCLLSYLRFE